MSPLLRYDHYKVLGIARDADIGQIKRAYRDRVKHCHPDRNPSPKAGVVFHAVHEAYRVLSDPGLREHYDERLLHYRDAKPNGTHGTPPHRPAFRTTPTQRAPDRAERLVFRGLHLTGLVFGCTLIAGILIGLVFFGWPAYMLALCIPGLAVIPDSISGLKR
jgi:curved DNA-binding protein CbpA